ncbi:MAG: hypothetical protein ABSB83_02595 [Methanomassiliicoccales archaeon]|jgi:hypothetical protein
MKTCNICGKAEGELALNGTRIQIENNGVCNMCKKEMANLEEIYSADYAKRTGQKIQKVIPWPAFKDFTWPDHSEVLVSGWELRTCEFAIALTEVGLVSGRRSILSYEDEAAKKLAELSKAIEASSDYEERTTLRRDFDRLRRKMVTVEELAKAGEHPLFMMAFENILDIEVKKDDDWLQVVFGEKKMKTGFFGGKKETVKSHSWKVSPLYEDVINIMVEKVRKKSPQ